MRQYLRLCWPSAAAPRPFEGQCLAERNTVSEVELVITESLACVVLTKLSQNSCTWNHVDLDSGQDTGRRKS